MIFNIEEQTAIKFAAITKGYALAYRKIWESLSGTDKKILGYFCEKEKAKVNEIRAALSMTSPVFSKYREKLLNRGLLASREYGTLELTLPRFGRFAKLQLTYEEE